MYQKPKIKITRVKLNYLFTQPRFLDSLDYNLDRELAVANCAPYACDSCISCGGGTGCGCFIKGTKVIMADGKTREIQNIRPGESILSYNLIRKKHDKSRVDELQIHNNYPGGYFIINNSLRVTDNHHFWVNNNLWQRADTLKRGDFLINSKGRTILIQKIEHVEGNNTVYNLHTSNHVHNYFAEDILAHNAASKM